MKTYHFELYKALEGRREKKRDYIGASSIGNQCWRAIWYDYNHSEYKKLTKKQLMTFEIGRYFESMILSLFNEAGLWVTSTASFKSVDIPEFRGHADGYLLEHDMLLEIKSARHSSFNIFKAKGLKIWNEQYYAQVQSYMGMSGIHKTLVLVIDKDTADIFEQIIEFDKNYYDFLVHKAQLIKDCDVAPKRISDNPGFYKCKMCFYKEKCFEG